MEAIMLKAGAQLVHLPYPGSPQAITAIIRNDAQMGCLPAISVTPHAAAGNGENPRRVDGQALAIPAEVPDVAGGRHRCERRRLERAHRPRRHTGGHHRADQQRRGRDRQTAGSARQNWRRN